MATKLSHHNPVCLMCLETHAVLKVVGSCKHVFCVKCLETHSRTSSHLAETITCPSCHAEFTLEGGLIENLMDAGEEFESPDAEDDGSKTRSKVKCKLCRFTKQTSIDYAETLCDECGQLYLCYDCTKIHATTSATANHVVSNLKSLKKKSKPFCKMHEAELNSFCLTCSEPCCHICVLLTHGEHEVKKNEDAFRSLVDKLNTASDRQDKRSNELKKFENQLKTLKMSEVSLRRGILLQEVEDHAEEYIELAIKQKNDMKDQVCSRYDVVEEVSHLLDKVPGLPELDASITKARQILSKAEPHPDDLRLLSVITQSVLRHRIDKDVDTRMDGYWETYQRLFQNPLHFSPNPASFNMGAMQEKQSVNTTSVLNAKLVSSKTYTVDDVSKFIPCVAVLGNELFAVAHPTTQGRPSDAIDIYKLPCQLQRTITENVRPLYDIAANPLMGELAVLSDGSTEGTCAVKLFDPANGFIRSTKDFAVRGPLSLDVYEGHRYVILSNDDGKRRVTILNEDGFVELVHMVDEVNHVQGACRISCSMKYIYLLGPKKFALYEQKEKELVMVAFRADYDYKDISTNLLDSTSVTECFYAAQYFHLESFDLLGNQFTNQKQKHVDTKQQEADLECRLSLLNNYIVSSKGQKLMVFNISI